MGFPKCDNRSDPDNRMKLASAYTILPVAHTRLLPGQDLQGCCGSIRDECFTFSYLNKLNSSDTGLFSVGRHCAQDFFTLTGTASPRMFNPLSTTATTRGAEAASTHAGLAVPMCGLNVEMYEAINLLVLDWGPPKSSLREILAAIAAAPSVPVSKKQVIHLNNILGKDRRGRKLSAIIGELRNRCPNLREFKFPTIESLISSANVMNF